jgi:endonuclease/exonuclease/phosphatase family metal-dependent hydrolase
MRDLFVAFWNTENLFDVENSAERLAWLRTTLKNELKGWTDQVLDKKTGQLSSIIKKMNGGNGPDLLGLVEVENKPVLQRLVDALAGLNRNYAIAHHDGSDQRGVDVAFIYDGDTVNASEQYSHVILKRTATRDLFQVNFKTKAGNDLIVIGNHWPARTEGVLESEPYRIIAGETLSYWARRIQEEKGKDCAILVMGDFNDDPFNRSIREYALSVNSPEEVLSARSPKFLNLMWQLLADGAVTFSGEGGANILDQFWISQGILNGRSKLRKKDGSVKIETFPELKDRSGNPRRFSRPSDTGYDPQGYSDHFPISMILQEL